MTTPAVSVVIPTFNRSVILIQALRSVLRQTHTDYEIIIVDDGSTDNTRDKLEPYKKRIRYCFQTNKGASAARNKGIELARGEWVAFLDSDDVWLPRKLQLQLEALNVMGKDFEVCFTGCMEKGQLAARGHAISSNNLKAAAINDPLKYHLAKQPVFFLPTLVVRRALLAELQGFDERLVVAEDTDLIFRLCLRAQFCMVTAPLVLIDRGKSRSVGLTDFFAKQDDQMYVAVQSMYKKWLAYPGLTDVNARKLVLESLRCCYYDSAISSLKRLNVGQVLRNITDMRSIGESYFKMIATLLSRFAKRLRARF